MTSKARKQSYKKEYMEKWPCIVLSKRDNCSVTCVICGSDFSIAHGGATDIQLHIGRNKHRNAYKGTANIATMFKQQAAADYSAIRAKTLMTNFSIEHNIALSAVDHLTDLLKVIFHDSVIASKKMVFRGTK